MLAARFDPSGKANIPTCLGKSKAEKKFSPCIIIGDSMVRFLSHMYESVVVYAIGGSKLGDLSDMLNYVFSSYNTFLIIIHLGTNNVNKIHYPGGCQLDKAKCDLEQAIKVISLFQDVYKFSVVYSGCIKTNSIVVNDRIKTLNSWILQECKKKKFMFIDNSNISCQELSDFVHLNTFGQKALIDNLIDFF